MTIRLLVVDDSGFFQRRMREILSNVPEIKIVGFASNGREALAAVAKLKPDVITLDYEIPVMDGLSCLRKLMRTHPTPVLMFSSLSYEGVRVTLDALEAGAVDYLPKNFEDLSRGAASIKQLLIEKIKAVACGKLRNTQSDPPSVAPTSITNASVSNKLTPSKESMPVAKKMPATSGTVSFQTTPTSDSSVKSISRPVTRTDKSYSLVVIGTSTGGPVALQRILVELPGNFPLPIILVQHMPGTFTTPFADRLDKLSSITVKEAQEGDILTQGRAFLAPGGLQLMLDKNRIHILPGDERMSYKPSVDIAFASAAKHYPGKTLAIVLTGMGADGRDGARLLKQTGATIWTQDEASCVIYGMPMAVERAGLSDEVLPLGKIAKRLIQEIM